MTHTKHDPTASVIGTLYEAATGLTDWTCFLASFAERVDAQIAALHVQDPSRHSGAVSHSSGLTPEWQQAYRDYYSKRNPWLLSMVPAEPAGRLRDSEALVSSRRLERSEFFNDFLAPQDLRFSLGVVVMSDVEQVATLTTLRSRSVGHYGQQERDVYQVFAPHVMRALRLQAMLSAQTSRPLPDGRPGHAVLEVDDTSVVRFANLEAKERWRIERWGPLTEGRSVPGPVGRCVARAAKLGVKGGIYAVGEPGKAFLEALVQTDPSTLMTTVRVFDPWRTTNGLSELVRHRFSLTPSEARVAVLLSEGRSLDEAGNILDVGKETVRSHLKRLFQKTGTRRQPELVALLSRIAANVGD